MTPLAAPVMALAGMSFYLAAYHFSLGLRRRDDRRKDLYFALTALSIAIYDVLCVALYESATVAEARVWQQRQLAALWIAALFLVHFVDAYASMATPRFLLRLSWTFPAFAVLSLWNPNDWVISDRASIKHVHLPWVGDFTYIEAGPGPLMWIIGIVIPYLALFLGFASWKMWRDGTDRRRVVWFVMGCGVFVLGAANDTLVGMELTQAPYLIEYAWTGMVLFVGHALSTEVIDAALAREELARSRERLAHVERLESVGQLAGGIAHDLNNMLTPVLSYAQLAQRKLAADSAEHGYLDHVIAAAERAALLTRQLLAFGRKQVFDVRAIDLDVALAELEPLLRRLLPETVELRIAYAEGLSPIDADVAQLEQVFMNLVANARDAMPKGGKISIRVAPATTPGAEPGVHVTVRDDGEGMDEKTRARVFEPFFTTKPRGKGTGLGLSTVHGIVQQHGGRITVESAPGAGTTFRLFFPTSKRARPATQRLPRTADGPRGSERVLVVDDDPAVRALVREVLVDRGYRVEEAGSESDLRSLLERIDGRIDLLLTDVMLPDTDGVRVGKLVSTRHPETSVLFMSGHSENILGDRGVLDANVALLRKPFTASSLTAKVRSVLDRRPRSSA